MNGARTNASWTKTSTLGAPLALTLGCVFAALKQPPDFDSTVDTISALAAEGAADRWLMTSALGALGACHVASALGLRTAAFTGRALLFVGGIATLMVAAFPLPASGRATAHFAAALSAFVLLAVWPAFAATPAASTPPALTSRTSALATLALCGLLALFGVSLALNRYVGLSERLVAFAEALWPAIAAFSARRK